MKKRLIALLSIVPLVVSCGGGTVESSSVGDNSSTSSSSTSSSRFGLEGNEFNDRVEKKGTDDLKSLLERASTIKRYTYETTSYVTGSESHFISYYQPNCYYELNDDFSSSIGYAQEKDTQNLFRFYMNEEGTEVYSSIYEYEGYTSDDMTIEKGLYGILSIADISLLSYAMDDFEASYVSGNKFILTDIDIASIFQYMTTFGSSIANYMTAVYINVIDYDTNKFDIIVDLGNYGTIESEFRPVEGEMFTDIVEEKLADENNPLKGVDEYADVASFLSLADSKVADGGYIIEGIKVAEKNGNTKPFYRIHLNQDYFYLEFLSYDAAGNEIENTSYDNFGMAYVKKGTPVTVKETQEDGSTKDVTYLLDYDACFEFEKKDGEFCFDLFKGPVENDGMSYLEVDELPEEGQSNILYILNDSTTGTKYVYEWIEVSDGVMGFSKYSSWYNSVGSFPVNDISASFYLGESSGFTDLGSKYFEKVIGEENSYHSSDSDILSILANYLFGWGFQSTTTWMSYVRDATLTISKDDSGAVVGGDVGLKVLASVNGGVTSLQQIFYTYDFQTSGAVKEVEDFFSESGVKLA